MNDIAKINCYFECSVVTHKLRKEYLNIVKYVDTGLILDKILNNLVYRTLFYVNIYGSYKLSNNSPLFGPPCGPKSNFLLVAVETSGDPNSSDPPVASPLV